MLNKRQSYPVGKQDTCATNVTATLGYKTHAQQTSQPSCGYTTHIHNERHSHHEDTRHMLINRHGYPVGTQNACSTNVKVTLWVNKTYAQQTSQLPCEYTKHMLNKRHSYPCEYTRHILNKHHSYPVSTQNTCSTNVIVTL